MTIEGYAGNDVLTGSDYNDNLKGGDGNDKLIGGHGVPTTAIDASDLVRI